MKTEEKNILRFFKGSNAFIIKSTFIFHKLVYRITQVSCWPNRTEVCWAKTTEKKRVNPNCTGTVCKRELQQDDMGSKRFRSLLFSRFGGTCVMLASCLGVHGWSTFFLAACTMRATTQAAFRTSRCKIAFSYRGHLVASLC